MSRQQWFNPDLIPCNRNISNYSIEYKSDSVSFDSALPKEEDKFFDKTFNRIRKSIPASPSDSEHLKNPIYENFIVEKNINLANESSKNNHVFDIKLMLERAISESDNQKKPTLRFNTQHDDLIGHLMNKHHSFGKDDELECNIDSHPLFLKSNISAVYNKHEEVEKQTGPKNEEPFTNFSKLETFLIKFFKCEEMSIDDYAFSPEDIKILKSFIKRKYKKKIDAMFFNKNRLHVV